MSIAALLGQQLLALETIVLAQHDAQGLGPPHQRRTHLVIQAGVGRKGDRLLLDRRVDVHLLELLRPQRLHGQRRLDGRLQ